MMCKDEDKKADVFSFGISMYEMLEGRKAWEHLSGDEIRQRVLSGERPVFSAKTESLYGAKVLDLVRACWKPEQQDRLEFSDVVQRLLELVPSREVKRDEKIEDKDISSQENKQESEGKKEETT